MTRPLLLSALGCALSGLCCAASVAPIASAASIAAGAAPASAASAVSATSAVSVALAVSAVSGAAAGAGPVAAATPAPLASAASGASAVPAALALLPPPAQVRAMLLALPQIRAGALEVELASAGERRLDAGHYEWMVRAGAQRRGERNGARFVEQELALERPVRWFGKAALDSAIGAKGVEVARAAYADVWHETGRALMAHWFAALREMAAVQALSEQYELARQLRDIAQRRFKAGDAARLELVQAETESGRVSALLQQAQQREEQALQLLAASYPGLAQPSVAALPLPRALTESAATWYARIMDDNHELELAQAQRDWSSLQAGRIASDRQPDPTIGLHASRERGGQERVLGLSIAIPLPGQARQADAGAALLKAGLAAERMRQTEVKVALAARQAVADCARTYASWQTLHEVGQQSQVQAAMAMTAYRLGEGALSEALNTRRQALDAAALGQAARLDALAAMASLYLDAHLLWSLD